MSLSNFHSPYAVLFSHLEDRCQIEMYHNQVEVLLYLLYRSNSSLIDPSFLVQCDYQFPQRVQQPCSLFLAISIQITLLLQQYYTELTANALQVFVNNHKTMLEEGLVGEVLEPTHAPWRRGWLGRFLSPPTLLNWKSRCACMGGLSQNMHT